MAYWLVQKQPHVSCVAGCQSSMPSDIPPLQGVGTRAATPRLYYVWGQGCPHAAPSPAARSRLNSGGRHRLMWPSLLAGGGST